MISPILPVYAPPNLSFERGEGSFLFGSDGRRYLDFGSGIAVTALGHAHPHLVKALQDQAAKLWHTSNLFKIPGQLKLAERLIHPLRHHLGWEADFPIARVLGDPRLRMVECRPLPPLSLDFRSRNAYPVALLLGA